MMSYSDMKLVLLAFLKKNFNKLKLFTTKKSRTINYLLGLATTMLFYGFIISVALYVFVDYKITLLRIVALAILSYFVKVEVPHILSNSFGGNR